MSTSIHEQITTIKTGSVNSYLIGTEKGFVLVDTGTPNGFIQFEEVFRSIDIEFTDLILIIITHAHSDHTGSAAEIQKRSAAPLIMHKEEADFVQKGSTPLPKGTRFIGKALMKLAGALQGKRSGYSPFIPDITVTDTYNLSKFGLKGFIVPTPGHSAGSISVVLEDEACFAGDSIFNMFGSFFPPFANDIETLLTTWDYFKTAPFTTFYQGHGKPIPKEDFLTSFDKLTRKYRST